MVRGKFKAIEQRAHDGYSGVTVVLQAVTDDGIEENKRYAKYTPSGRIEMTVDNPPALAALPLGSVHYVDFSAV